MESRLGVDVRHRTHEVLQDVREVNAHVEQQAADVLQVPPHRDQHLVAAAGRVVDHVAGRSDHAGVQQGLGEPVYRIAAVVLGDRQDAPGPVRGFAHEAASADRETHGLLRHHVPSPGRRVGAHRVMETRIGADVDGLQVAGVHFVQTRDHRGTDAEMVFDVTGQGFGVLRLRVAGHHGFEPAEARTVQFGQAIEVPVPHAAAAHQSQSDL